MYTNPEAFVVNDLKKKIYSCGCKRCRSVVSLIENYGAKLRIRASSAGRLCELAVVAAEGHAGMHEQEVVGERRNYARHLRLKLDGPVSNSDKPNHIGWAYTHSNHNPEAKHRINLGAAKVYYREGVYTLV